MRASLKSRTASGAGGVRGFTMIEIVVAMGVFGIFLGGCVTAFTLLNQEAHVARLRTAALTVVQNEFDALFTSTYVPQQGQIPPRMVIGSHVQDDVPVYIDPDTDQVQTTGTLTTTVGDAGISLNNVDLGIRTVEARLTYVYRGKQYEVELHTLRAPDL